MDGEILAERDVMRERANDQAGGGSLPTGGASGAGGAGGTTGDVATSGAGVPQNRNAPPGPGRAGSGAVPGDIPDARDDDIIARQLREAAMQEVDPELKEKLWEEYRRYKKS